MLICLIICGFQKSPIRSVKSMRFAWSGKICNSCFLSEWKFPLICKTWAVRPGSANVCRTILISSCRFANGMEFV